MSMDDPLPYSEVESHNWTGFKIVGDNLDKTVRPRHMRLDRQAESLHYFHSYAVKDRINFGNISDVPPECPQNPSRDLVKLLPSSDDIHAMQSLFGIHISRILVEHLPFMKPFAGVVDWHIPHVFSSEMAQKSKVVSVFTQMTLLSKIDNATGSIGGNTER